MRFLVLVILIGGLFLVALAFGMIKLARQLTPLPGEPPPVAKS